MPRLSSSAVGGRKESEKSGKSEGIHEPLAKGRQAREAF